MKCFAFALCIPILAGCGGSQKSGPKQRVAIPEATLDAFFTDYATARTSVGRIPKDLTAPPKDDKRFEPEPSPLSNGGRYYSLAFVGADAEWVCFSDNYYKSNPPKLDVTADDLMSETVSRAGGPKLIGFATKDDLAGKDPFIHKGEYPFAELDHAIVVSDEIKPFDEDGEVKQRRVVVTKICGKRDIIPANARFIALMYYDPPGLYGEDDIMVDVDATAQAKAEAARSRHTMMLWALTDEGTVTIP